jgi:glyoxylase-like metal-dependent hydrolase (beta-lactamase superfamily II)
VPGDLGSSCRSLPLTSACQYCAVPSDMQPLMLPAMNPGPITGEGNRTWLIPGRRAVLVDAGVGDPRHLHALHDALHDAGAVLESVVLTHAHTDHTAGVAAIQARWPTARVLKYPWPDVDDRLAFVLEPLRDGQLIPAADDALVVVHTPGHSPDHICLWHQQSRTLFGGDLLIAGGTVVIPASRGGRLSDYLRSLERVLALDPATVLPAHGADINRPADLIRGNLAHRNRREAQVLEALARGPATPAMVAGMIYDRLPDPLQRQAEESVLAHLVKLEEEGRATSDGDRYALLP